MIYIHRKSCDVCISIINYIELLKISSNKDIESIQNYNKKLIIVAICILHIDIPKKKLRNSFIVALKTISISRKRCRFKPPRWSVFFLIDTYTHSFIYICEHLQKFTYTFLFILLWTSTPCHKQWNINKYTNYHSYTSIHTMIHSQKHRHKTHTHEYIRYDLTYKYT